MERRDGEREGGRKRENKTVSLMLFSSKAILQACKSHQSTSFIRVVLSPKNAQVANQASRITRV